MEFTQSGRIWASFSTVAVESGIVLMSLLVTASPAVGASFQLPLKPDWGGPSRRVWMLPDITATLGGLSLAHSSVRSKLSSGIHKCFISCFLRCSVKLVFVAPVAGGDCAGPHTLAGGPDWLPASLLPHPPPLQILQARRWVPQLCPCSTSSILHYGLDFGALVTPDWGCSGSRKEPEAWVVEVSLVWTSSCKEQDEDVNGKKSEPEAESGAPLESPWPLKITSKQAPYKQGHPLFQFQTTRSGKTSVSQTWHGALSGEV